MSWLETTFFESPFYVFVTLGFLELALAAVWYERRGRRLLAALAGPPVLAGVVALVAAVVQTDREQIVAALREIAADVEAGRIDAVRTYLDEDYSGHGMTRQGALDLAGDAVERYGVRSLKLTGVSVAVSGDSAEGRVTTLIAARGSLLGDRPVPYTWDLRWRKRPTGWRIVQADLILPG